MNLWVSLERGSPPHSKKRIRPPRIARTFLNTRKFHRRLSRPQAPNQLPLIADNLRAYAKSNNFLARPPFASTWSVNKIHYLCNHLVSDIKFNILKYTPKYIIIITMHACRYEYVSICIFLCMPKFTNLLAHTISNTIKNGWDSRHHCWYQSRGIPLCSSFYPAWCISKGQRGSIPYCTSNSSYYVLQHIT